MPTYTYQCLGCGNMDDYLLPMGTLPGLCSGCHDIMNPQFQRVYQGQTFGVGQGSTGNTPLRQVSMEEILHNSIPFSALPHRHIIDKRSGKEIGVLVAIPR